jgi:virulence factor Mce-like protein
MATQHDAEAGLRAGDKQGDADSAFALGELLIRRGNLEEAGGAFRRADERGHPTAPALTGLLAELAGDPKQAEAAYRRADERGDAYGAYRLAMLLSGGRHWKDADAAMARAHERGKNEEAAALEQILRARKQPDGVAPAAGQRSAFANRVLVGATTLLVALVAVFLAYNSNSGLPFVPTRELKVDIADGSNLVVGNDVREGGFRIGLVSSMKPVSTGNGTVAQLTLRLNKSNGSLPVDSTVTILPRSVLGLKFVSVTRGHSSKTFPDGATVPLSQTSVPVQFDDVFKTFDGRTRSAIQQNLAGYGDVVTARGSSLNDTLHSLPALLQHLEPVAAYLSDPRTQLTRFLRSLNRFMGTVAPVAQVNARLFTDMATTFEAISRDPGALERTIAESPSTLEVSTNSLQVQQPFLVDLTTLGNDLTPATAELRAALPDINPAIEAGTSTLKRAPVLNTRLQGVMNALKSLALAPGTNQALNALQSTTGTLNPMVRYLGPFQTVCDYWNYWWTYLAEHLSGSTRFGFAQRVMLNFSDATQPYNVGSQGAAAPAGTLGGPEYLHSQNYGAAIDNKGNADCETGQRGYPKKLNFFDPMGRNLATDQHTPGNQGPTFHGRLRVPKGETFSRNPTTGAQTLHNPTNP